MVYVNIYIYNYNDILFQGGVDFLTVALSPHSVPLFMQYRTVSRCLYCIKFRLCSGLDEIELYYCAYSTCSTCILIAAVR